MSRRQHITVLIIIGVSAFLGSLFVSIFRSQAEGTRHPDYLPSYQGPVDGVKIDDGILHGEATAPKLENATLKYVLPKPGHIRVLISSKGRARERSMEGPSHDDGKIPRSAHRRR
jgi:hypothetical protein